MKIKFLILSFLFSFSFCFIGFSQDTTTVVTSDSLGFNYKVFVDSMLIDEFNLTFQQVIDLMSKTGKAIPTKIDTGNQLSDLVRLIMTIGFIIVIQLGKLWPAFARIKKKIFVVVFLVISLALAFTVFDGDLTGKEFLSWLWEFVTIGGGAVILRELVKNWGPDNAILKFFKNLINGLLLGEISSKATLEKAAKSAANG